MAYDAPFEWTEASLPLGLSSKVTALGKLRMVKLCLHHTQHNDRCTPK